MKPIRENRTKNTPYPSIIAHIAKKVNKIASKIAPRLTPIRTSSLASSFAPASSSTITAHPTPVLNSILLAISILFSATFVACFTSTPVSADTQDFYFDSFDADYYLSRDSNNRSHLRVVEKLTAVFPTTNQNHGIMRVIPYTMNHGANVTMTDLSRLDLKVTRNGQEEPYTYVRKNGYFEVRIGSPDSYVRGRQIYRLEYEFQDVLLAFSAPASKKAAMLGGKVEADARGKVHWQELYWDTNGNDWPQTFDSLVARVHLSDTTPDAPYAVSGTSSTAPDASQTVSGTSHTTSGASLASAVVGQPSCYVGLYGVNDQDRCTITKISDGYQFEANDLTSGENLTFNIMFRPDTATVVAPRYNLLPLLIPGLGLALLIATLIIILHLLSSARTNARKYKNTPVKPEYTPPAGFTVAEMAENYLGKHIKGSSAVATLLELAVTHKIELISHETTGLLGKPTTAWTIRVISTSITSEQATLLQVLSGNTDPLVVGDEIPLRKSARYDSKLEQLAKSYGKHIRKSLVSKGLHTHYVEHVDEKKPMRTTINGKTYYCVNGNKAMLISILIPFATLFVIPIIASVFSDLTENIYLGRPIGADWAIIGFVATAFVSMFAFTIICGHYIKYDELTDKGIEMSQYLEGLYLYIKMAESERLKFLQSVSGADTSSQGIVKLYEKLLPYASLFGLEKSWLMTLGKYYESANIGSPDWCRGSSFANFHASSFTRAMQSATQSASTTFSHSLPGSSSSSSSGGGGGGSSGGGGGGGGGGGW